MCAIHGYCWQDEKLIGEMLCKAHHRGPDGQGTFFNDDISLGHNLLSITDTPVSYTHLTLPTTRYL